MYIKKVQRKLMLLFSAVIVVVLLMVLLFETEVLPSGTMAGNRGGLEFILVALMELVTLACIPLALRLFKFKKVKEDLKNNGVVALKRWGVIRLALLDVPMLLNAVFYYLFMNTTFGYMGIICLLCMPFVYPGLNRCMSELEV